MGNTATPWSSLAVTGDVLNYLTINLDTGYYIDRCYHLDIQKAFHSVPHKQLLHKLTTFGIHGKLLKNF